MRATLATPIDPLAAVVLKDALRRLVAEHGKDAVRREVDEIGRSSVMPEASREQKERLGAIVTALAGCWPKDQIMRLMQLHRNKQIPTEVSLELLDRVAKIRPANPWGFINTVMRKDYAHYKWGRG